MSDSIIKVENLSKKYLIKHETEGAYRYNALRDVIADNIQNLWQTIRYPGSKTKDNDEEFWALKDVYFEIKRGEVVGIIGRNGAGKSTLLKILSRITEPTTGRISIKGRVASLLEVGTGFHPELTGRENIFLNGAILGMSKQEINKKFDEIVEFAELKKFLDTPVKRYSSGMYVRLAFAVAAHLEPEILVIDEVLAVGDISFQKKCLGKMEDVANKEGRTVLFVSHNMAAVENLCNKGILLNYGQIVDIGSTKEIINKYLLTMDELTSSYLKVDEIKQRKGNGKFRFIAIEFLDSDGNPTNTLSSGQPVKIKINYESEYLIQPDIHRISIGFKDYLGQFIFNCPSDVGIFKKKNHQQFFNQGDLLCTIPKLPLKEGSYRFSLFSSINEEVTDWIQDAGIITVSAGDFYGTGKLPPQTNSGVLIDFFWEVLFNESEQN